jgi:hypothetical protein
MSHRPAIHLLSSAFLCACGGSLPGPALTSLPDVISGDGRMAMPEARGVELMSMSPA